MKNNFLLFVFCLFSFSFFSASTNAQWEQTNGPYGGVVLSLADDGTNLFAGTRFAGIFRSTNYGLDWTAINNGLPEPYFGYEINALIINGSILYAGTAYGVYRTTDYGTNWVSVNDGLKNLYISSLIFKGNDLFAGTGSGGVFLLTNNGSNWIEKNDGLTNLFITSLVLKGSTLFVSTGLTSGAPGGVFSSSNDGLSWEPTSMTNWIRTLFVKDQYIFASSQIAGVYRSGNNGQTWDYMVEGLPNFGLIMIGSFVADGTNLFVGTFGFGVCLSTNNGDNWEILNNTGLRNTYITSLHGSNANLFAGTGGNGVFLSSDAGSNWVSRNNGLVSLTINALESSNTNLLAGTAGGDGFFLSTNNGDQWFTTEIPGHSVKDFTRFGSYLYAASYGVFRSSNDGVNWVAMNTGLTNLNVNALTVNGLNLFAGTNGGVFRLTNGGTNWTQVNNGLTNLTINALGRCGSNIFAATDGGVFRSIDIGMNWEPFNTGMTALSIQSFVDKDSLIFAGGHGGVFRTTENGSGWTMVNNGLTEPYVRSLLVIDSIILAGTVLGVYRSINDGENWTARNQGLTEFVYALTVHGTNLFAGTLGKGVWRRPVSEITSVELIDNNYPEIFNLSQNYPNPFNPSTIIKFQIPTTSFVELKVFDLLGREVAILINNELSPGSYETTFDGAGLSSGVYFYRIKAGEFVQTKKLILQK